MSNNKVKNTSNDIHNFLLDNGYALVTTKTIAEDESIDGKLYPNKTSLVSLLKEGGFFPRRIIVLDSIGDEYKVSVYVRDYS